MTYSLFPHFSRVKQLSSYKFEEQRTIFTQVKLGGKVEAWTPLLLPWEFIRRAVDPGVELGETQKTLLGGVAGADRN